MKRKVIDVFGWAGVLAILAGYCLVSFEVLSAKSAGYQLLNVIGALLIVIEAGYKKDLQPAALNFIWLIVAAVALARMI